MPKKAVKIPAARKSEGVRWTLQVSADAAEKSVRAPTPHGRRTSARPQAQRPRKSQSARKPVAAVTVATRRPEAAPTTTRSASVNPSPAVSLSTGRRMAAIAAGSVLVMAALALMRDPSRSVSANVHAQPASAASVAATMSVPPEAPQVSRTAVAVRAPSPAARNTGESGARLVTPEAPQVSRTAVAVRAPSPAATNTDESVARLVTPEAPPSALVPRSNGGAETLSSADVTITGCLESTVDGDQFRLTNTEGAEAPKARGWRSGFLKKRSAAVELVNFKDTSTLRRLVGHRVVTTGLLDSRELSVRSIASAGQTCD